MNTNNQSIEIPLSKTKLTLMFMGALAFVAIGCWFVISPPEIQNSYWGNPVRIMVASYGAIVFFGGIALMLVRKLRDTRPGLIMDQAGLTDNSSSVSAGQILWTDIEDISVIEIHRQKLIMVYVKNPQEYINRQPGMLKRRLMLMNYKMYGTPLSITANGLNIAFESLLSTLVSKFNESRQ